MVLVKVPEAGVLAVKHHTYHANRAVTLFGDDNFGDVTRLFQQGIVEFDAVLEFIFCNYFGQTYFPKWDDLTIVIFTTLRKVGSLPIGLDLKTVSAKCRMPNEPRNENMLRTQDELDLISTLVNQVRLTMLINMLFECGLS